MEDSHLLSLTRSSFKQPKDGVKTTSYSSIQLSPVVFHVLHELILYLNIIQTLYIR